MVRTFSVAVFQVKGGKGARDMTVVPADIGIVPNLKQCPTGGEYIGVKKCECSRLARPPVRHPANRRLFLIKLLLAPPYRAVRGVAGLPGGSSSTM